MLTSITSLTRNGLGDFVLQRLSAYLLTLYFLLLLGFFLTEPGYSELRMFFSHAVINSFTLLAVLSLAVHAWIGLWTIGGDYIQERAFGRFHTWLRGIYQIVCGLMLFFYVAWCAQILWSL